MTLSPAMQLLRLIWDHQGEQYSKSWRGLNRAMSEALGLAITAGLRFDPGDFGVMAGRLADNPRDFNSSFWLDTEWVYALACGCNRNEGRVNKSACVAIEHHVKRAAFLLFEPHKDPCRLCVGRQVFWQDRWVKVTSFAKDGKSLIACAYLEEGKRAGRDAPVARLKITLDALARIRRAVKAESKLKAEIVAAEAAKQEGGA